MMEPFSEQKWNEAFSRTLGWVTEDELKIIQSKKVAIAGSGGVGGHYAEIMARLGFSHFHIADPDIFELPNLNRQNGSGLNSLGKPKVEIIRSRILDINPHATVRVFADGLTQQNLTEFLQDIDIYIDGLDFFVLYERIWLFDELRKKEIPAIISGPVGMGVGTVIFDKNSMSFEDYFGISEKYSIQENSMRFLSGLTPSLMQRHYQVDASRVNLGKQKVPSTPMGCYLCAGVSATEALKIVLRRGKVFTAPWCLHFDSYLCAYKKTWTWAGFRNPLQILKMLYVRKRLTGKFRPSLKSEST